MSQCDMCGKKQAIVVAAVENVEMSLCEDCSKYGITKRRLAPTAPFSGRKKSSAAITTDAPSKVEVIVQGYGNIIKKAREKKGLTQEEFGKTLNEKASEIHAFESEHREPNVETARKLEKLLHITLIQAIEVQETHTKATASKGLTIGDLIKMK